MAEPAGFKLSLCVPAATVAAVEAVFQALGAVVVRDPVEGGAEVPLEIYLREEPAPAEIAKALAWAGLEVPEVSTEALPALDWVAESQKGLPPLHAGRFFVYAAHAAERRPAAALAIQIEAGQAFGTGHHESTRGCLLALEAQARHTRPRRCLDLGCGSGILAIAMAKCWHVPVLAADIDPLAVAVARENVRLNGTGPLVRTVESDSASRRSLRATAPFDLIVANILAGPLRALAGGLCPLLAPGGRLILSGLLRSQERSVLAPYRARRLCLARRLTLGDWVTLTLKG